ncbi:MAG: ThiF family adenylyltransferase, partial [Bacteroidota bacterium]
RIMMSDAAALAKVPLIHASLFRFEGHLTMFHHDEAGRRWTLRSVFPDYPDQILSDCSNEGIAGPVAQSVAGMQSMEVLKYLTGIGNNLMGRLLIIDLLTNIMTEVEVPADAGIRQEAPSSWSEFRMRYMDNKCGEYELEAIRLSDSEFIMIDIREEFELSGPPVGIHMPMAEVRGRLSDLPSGINTVFVCDRGIRSATVVQMLRKEFGMQNVFSLRGGIATLQDGAYKAV